MNAFIPTIEPLPGPGFVERTLVEQPWPGVVALAVIGALVGVMLLRRGLAGAAAAAVGVAATLAGGLFAVASIVTTDHERVAGGTREVVRAALAGDAGAVGELLAPDARLTAAGADMVSVDRDTLLAAVASIRARAPTRGHGVLDRTASIDGPNAARSRVVIRADLQGGGPSFSAWQLNWRLEPDGVWRVTRLEAISINGRAPGAWLAGEVARMAR